MTTDDQSPVTENTVNTRDVEARQLLRLFDSQQRKEQKL